MSESPWRFCPVCAGALAPMVQEEDGGPRERMRCAACGWTHWNNPTPVLAAIVEFEGKVLLARNAAWPPKLFGLVAGFLEAGESPREGMVREIKEETDLDVSSLELVGVYDFQRMNQVIIAWHAQAHGQVRLSPELAEWRLYAPDEVLCWRAGTGQALADWLRSRGYEPRWRDA